MRLKGLLTLKLSPKEVKTLKLTECYVTLIKNDDKHNLCS